MEPDTEEQFSSQPDDSCEAIKLDAEEQFSSQNNDSCEINVDYNLQRIPINGVEDMGGIDFKKFTTTDIVKYDFPNLEVAFTFYNWQGFRKDRYKDNKKHVREAKTITRCGCRAKYVVHVDPISQRWCIRFIDDVHTHPFVEQEFIMFLPGHRGMDDDDILQMNHFKKSGIRTPQVSGKFANQVGGYEHVTFSLRDMYNVVDKERRSKGTDSRAALAYLCSLKSSDPTMYWKHTVDKEGSNEGKMPKSVITDGDLAMKNAIRRVLPDSHHRLCAWHLIRNSTSNVKSNKFSHLFSKLMLCDYEIVDFERKWNEMVNECGVHDNHWVLDMYEKKEMWATTHIREAYAETMEILNDHYRHIKSKYELQLKDGEKIEGHSDRYLQNPVTAKTKGRGGNIAGRNGNKRKQSQCDFCGIIGRNKQTCGVLKKQKSLVNKSNTTDDDEDKDEDGVGGDDDDDDDDEDYRG
ncbi:hypothetical protein TSUD_18760 [Trifolium subterraneum]|uniref:MULE transposase domain-containing protein n=1 Tax=Trifolium subterraneum TaxID=3900 RepID=A0A2Z6MCQ8_TRISU|nr:hypothetical protein TSUD_18760 [Trifolium subterraneum]